MMMMHGEGDGDEINEIIMMDIEMIIIRECDSTFYVGLAHAAPPTQYKAFMAFSNNWLSEGST